MYALGIDIGGTKMAFGLVDAKGNLAYSSQHPSQTQSEEAMYAGVLAGIKDLLAQSQVQVQDLAGIGCGLPGKVDPDQGMAVISNNLPWQDFPLRCRLQEDLAFAGAITLENDVNVAAYYENFRVAPQPGESLVYLTLSTGIACTALIDRQILHGHGFAGEVGFIPVAWENGQDLSWEAVGSGPGIARLYGGNTSPAEVFDRAKSGEARALEVLDRVQTYHVRGLQAIIAVLDPHYIVIGGSVAFHNPDYMEGIIDKLSHRLHPEQAHIIDKISLSQAGSKNGLLGAAMMSWAQD